MNKKPYEAPTVKTIRLEVRNAILAVCHSSPNMTPKDQIGTCFQNFELGHCFNPNS